MARLDVAVLVEGRPVTAAARSFLARMRDDIEFLQFVSAQIAWLKHMVLGQTGAEQAEGPIKQMVDALPRHAAVNDEMFFVRVVDSFLIYVADILREILAARPEILSGTEKIKTERLLKATSLQELIDEVIDEHVASLSYKGFRDLREWFGKQGVQLCAVPADEPVLIEAIAIRNLFVHSRGRVDARFKKTVPTRKEKIGATLRVRLKYINLVMKTIASTVAFVDAIATKKFGLSVDHFPEA